MSTQLAPSLEQQVQALSERLAVVESRPDLTGPLARIDARVLDLEEALPEDQLYPTFAGSPLNPVELNTTRAAATPFTVTKPTIVSLSVKAVKEKQIFVVININGVFDKFIRVPPSVNEQVTNATFAVPAGGTWEWAIQEGEVTSAKSSYYQ
jgi:hypothetical protein